MRNPTSTTRILLSLSAVLLFGCAKSMPMNNVKPEADMGHVDLLPETVPEVIPVDCDADLQDRAGCPCPGEGDKRGCYTGPKGTANVGACHDGEQLCMLVGEFMVWGDCAGAVTPKAEICSSTDDANCNGLVGCQ